MSEGGGLENRLTMQQIIVSGIGGQGVLFVTRLLAETAVALGHSVLISETHGMAQRGGNVISHLKVGRLSTASPLIRPGRADVFLGLHSDAFLVHGYYLKPEGRAFCTATDPDSEHEIDAIGIATELGSPVSANLVLLGFATSSGLLFCKPDDLERQLTSYGGERQEINLKALRAGLKAYPQDSG
jgi:indolepyruvate ferredoxin oxidoreductase beta subunit